MTEKEMFMSKMEDEILDLIDHREDFTRSDLQGCVMAIVRMIMNYKEKE